MWITGQQGRLDYLCHERYLEKLKEKPKKACRTPCFFELPGEKHEIQIFIPDHWTACHADRLQTVRVRYQRRIFPPHRRTHANGEF